MTQVYRIDKTRTHDNPYEINVDEIWIIVPDEYFYSLGDAETYVIKMNAIECGHYLGITRGNADNFVADRCLSTEWCHKQRYFITRPNIKLLRNNLEKEGIITYVTSPNKIMVSSLQRSTHNSQYNYEQDKLTLDRPHNQSKL